MRSQLLRLLYSLAVAGSVLGNTVEYTATYDDIQQGITPTPVGTYLYLQYNAWSYSGIQNAVPVRVGGIQPQSPPITISAGFDTELTMGTPTFTIAPPYKTFVLIDFYFGCPARTTESTANLDLQCTVTVAGFHPITNQEVAVDSFTFTPPLGSTTPVPMMHAVLSSEFSQPLYNVTMIIDNKLAALVLDNLRYKVST